MSAHDASHSRPHATDTDDHDDDVHTILVVDGDRVARTRLGDELSADGYEVIEAGSAGAARKLLEQERVDLAIVARGLPDEDGLELLRDLRQAQADSGLDRDLPLVVSVAKSSAVERIRAYELGCDDIVDAAVDYTELRVRVAAVLRRHRRARSVRRLRVGSLQIDVLSRQVWVGVTPLPLSGKEFSLLCALAREPGRVFSRAELMQTVWGWQDAVAASRTRTLDTHLARLRRKLAAHGLHCLTTVWGRGLRLTDAVAEPHAPALRLVGGGGSATADRAVSQGQRRRVA